MTASILRRYDLDECGADGVPLDWDRCRRCGGSGSRTVNYGHTVNADGSLGGRGMRSTRCKACAGYGSLRAAALASMMGTPYYFTALPPSGWGERRPRCGDCGHPMSEGTWEYLSGCDELTWTAHELFVGALDALIAGRQPELGPAVHYSPCNEGCRHGMFRCRADSAPWFEAELSTAEMRTFLEQGVDVDASWRHVDVRTMSSPRDLRPENCAVLCLRCWAARVVAAAIGVESSARGQGRS